MGDYRHSGGGRGQGGGHKRRREDSQPLDPQRLLLSSLFSFGDSAMPSLQVDEDAVTKHLKRDARNFPEAVQTMLIDCAVQLSTKAPLYALLVGLLNVDEPELVQSLVQRLGSDLEESLLHGDSLRKARLLLRFAAGLVVARVLQPASVLAVLAHLVKAALEIADAAPAKDDGRSWQPYADQLVYVALAALPFGGPELTEAVPEQVQELLDAADAYMGKRPRSSQPGLRPFAAAIKDYDPLAECDNGGASFLPEVVAAVKQMVGDGQWQLEGIPRVHMAVEATLAAAEQIHELAVPEVPLAPPVVVPAGASPALVGALVLQAFPARGIMRFIDAHHTEAGRPPVERLVAEDYILDTVHYFEGDRVECAKRLARALPLPYPYEPLLCEVLFGQMLRLPLPEFKPIMYSTLMVDLCKLQKPFPRAMSTCVRECFARMNVMDPALRDRLAEWLAYHLSNFEYMWPWGKWQHVLEAPPYDGQRRFCVAVMNRLMRLSYWDRVISVVPEEFRPLLPPKPEVTPLPAPDDSEDLEGAWAARALQLVRSKSLASELESWLRENSLEVVLGGKLGVLRMLARCLLVAGAKSYTHMSIALERYFGPLEKLAKEAGLEGEIALVEAATSVWAHNPQRAAMAVDRLMGLRLASAEAIVTWVFHSDGVRSITDESRCGMAWDILYAAVDKTTARVQDATEELVAGRAHVEYASAAAASGAGSQDAANAALEALPEKEAYLAETTAQQQGAVLQVLQCFAEMLGEGGVAAATSNAGDGDAMDTDTDEHTALHDYTLASLKSFLRRYNLEAAQVAERIESDILSAPLTQEVKGAIEAHLYL